MIDEVTSELDVCEPQPQPQGPPIPEDCKPVEHVPFIASYHGDFWMLGAALRSHKLNGRDWMPPVVCVDSKDKAGAEEIVAREFPEARVVVKDPIPGGSGYMRAQCAMLSCDLLSPDMGDYFWLFGSDTFLVKPFSPFDGWSHDYARPVMLYTPHKTLGRITKHWQEGVSEALGWLPEHDYMRRLPLPYPRVVYPEVRAAIEKAHPGKTYEEYVHGTARGPKGYHSKFSESNVMGAYAWKNMNSIYHWINTDLWAGWHDWGCWQMWSHGGEGHVDPRTGESQGVMLRKWGFVD
jgi:hypothetical protein